MQIDHWLPDPPPPGRRHRLGSWAGAGEGLGVARYAARINKPLLFIHRDIQSAQHLAEEIRYFAPHLPVRLLPEWDVLPYDRYSPTNSGQRIATLSAWLNGETNITITTAAAALSPYAPPHYISARSFHLSEGRQTDFNALIQRLTADGYQRVDRVLSEGQFAVYGGQIDCHPPDSDNAIRLVFIDDDIEQIRLFDPQTQRSTDRLPHFHTLPINEHDASPAGLKRFSENFTRHFGDDPRENIRHRIEEGEFPAGSEYYLPLFHTQTGRLFDYLPPHTVILMHHAARPAATDFLHQAHRRQHTAHSGEDRPALPVPHLYLNQETLTRHLRAFPLIELGEPKKASHPPLVTLDPRQTPPHTRLKEFLTTFDGTVLICLDGIGRIDTLRTALRNENHPIPHPPDFATALRHRHAFTHACLRGGFILPQDRLAILTEAELFSQPALPRQQKKATAIDTLHWSEIAVGDHIVHHDYGIGISRGLKTLTLDHQQSEFLEIEYADNQRLWLPITDLQQLNKHPGGVPLSKMGSGNWKRARTRAEKRATDTAAHLIEIHARRLLAKKAGRTPDPTLLTALIERFPYTETPDQEKAAQTILTEITAAKAMDRLLAADVGFGKTEIALRAVAAVVFSGEQAAILAPTGLLAEQHHRTFTDRFAGFPTRIDLLSRLIPDKERRAILTRLKSGETDIIIGTHALLQKNVHFRRLGLAVIDEEHRFGVRHKEHFKQMRAETDILALSATPIPRTLALSFTGIRDLTIIATPPDRLAVITLIAPASDSVIIEACERETRRGGQIYFIHNEIRSLEARRRDLARCLPKARIVIAHGQMPPPAINTAMRAFLRREADILLCTTIVESGLDIANANTIIIDRADRIGLSRLHQLRGRVGRGDRQAYAYLLLPEDGHLTRTAARRLDAIKQYGVLGGGFHLSMRDLEIRGGGEILGDRQSGDIETIGLTLYQNMIRTAARRLRGETAPPIIPLTINLGAPALLPDSYLPSPVERMHYYRRLQSITDETALNDLRLEWLDRLGPCPPAATNLLTHHRLRLIGEPLGLKDLRIDPTSRTAYLHFIESPPCAPALLHQITLGRCRVTPTDTVALSLPEDPETHAPTLLSFLHTLHPTPQSV